MQNKRLILGLAIVLIAGGIIAVAMASNNKKQVASESSETEAMVKDDAMMMDDSHLLGVVMTSGKIMTVWEGNELANLDHDITLKNGTKVSKEGVITSSTGTVITLQDGQELTTDGQIIIVDTSKMMMMKDGKMSDDKMTKEDGEAMEKEDAMMKALSSTYVDYSPEVLTQAELAQESGRKVVLFFHAKWCPFCIAADKDFKANIGTDKFPKNVTLIKTDYDSQTELKKKYGVTTQHTFVQIDSNGNQITKWISGETPDLTKNLK